MPHIILEYPSQVNGPSPIGSFIGVLHETLGGFDTVDIARIKTRAIPIVDSVVGAADNPDHYMHITIKLLPGRSSELKKDMAQCLQDLAKEYSEKSNLVCAVSAEVQELDADSYCG